MDIGVTRGIPVGNGILTVDNEAQAWVRARPDGQDKGGGGRQGRAGAGAAQALARQADGQDARPAVSDDPPKANRRGAARLAAVQALYQMDIAGKGLNDILAEFESHWLGQEVEGEQYLPAEAAFFRDIVRGVHRRAAPARSADRPGARRRLAAQARRGDPARGAARRRLRARPAAGHPGARGRVGICRRRQRVRRSRGDRHGQCGARCAGAKIPRRRVCLRAPLTAYAAGSAYPAAMAARKKTSRESAEDRLIARHFRPLATHPGALGLDRRCGGDRGAARARSRAQDRRRHRRRAFLSRRSARGGGQEGAADQSLRSRRQGRAAARLPAVDRAARAPRSAAG